MSTREFAVVDVPTPEAGVGQVRIKVAAAGVCLSDVHFLEGILSPGYLDGDHVTLGHEVAGVVDQVGPGVTTSAVGDRVVVIAGVLDWELATVGDPMMDLGSALAYWVDRDDEPAFASLRRQPSHLPGMPTREQFVARYLELSGRKCDDFTFYEVFGLFRLAVIIQQIWARSRAGQTTNPAFAGFGAAVNTLINRAEGKIA